MEKFLNINPKKEEQRIIAFLEKTLQKTGFKKLILGLSGGIDSTTNLYLVRKILPAKNIFIAHLYYFQPPTSNLQQICSKLQIPAENQHILSIKKSVDELISILKPNDQLEDGRIRVGPPAKQASLLALRAGNIMARIRMIILFDLAKKHNALVCGTENKSEHLLGYFTRFGDAASDIEPIQHLYKTQVYQLAKYLNVPPEIINAKPSAGLWTDQTDEGEFGFSYQEADPVLYLYFEKKQTVEEIKKLGCKKAQKIIDFALQNSFKHEVPYTL